MQERFMSLSLPWRSSYSICYSQSISCLYLAPRLNLLPIGFQSNNLLLHVLSFLLLMFSVHRHFCLLIMSLIFLTLVYRKYIFSSLNISSVYTNPPQLVIEVLSAVCVLFQKEPTWPNAKLMLADTNFLKQLIEFDKDSVSNRVSHILL